jgi:hypothetical protein
MFTGYAGTTADGVTLNQNDVAKAPLVFQPISAGVVGPSLVTITWTGGSGSAFTFYVKGTGQ